MEASPTGSHTRPRHWPQHPASFSYRQCKNGLMTAVSHTRKAKWERGGVRSARSRVSKGVGLGVVVGRCPPHLLKHYPGTLYGRSYNSLGLAGATCPVTRAVANGYLFSCNFLQFLPGMLYPDQGSTRKKVLRECPHFVLREPDRGGTKTK